MDVHSPKNGINRYWSIPILEQWLSWCYSPAGVLTAVSAILSSAAVCRPWPDFLFYSERLRSLRSNSWCESTYGGHTSLYKKNSPVGFLLALKASEKYVYVFWNSHPSSGSENETNLERASSLPSYSSPFQHLNRTQLDLLGRCECKLPHAWLRVEKRGKWRSTPCDVAASGTNPWARNAMAYHVLHAWHF